MKYFLFLFMHLVYVYDICACLCVGVCTYLCMSIDQRRMFNVSIYFSSLYSFETGSLSEKGARLVASKVQWSSFLHPHSTGLQMHKCGHVWPVTWMLRSELRFSCTASAESFLQIPTSNHEIFLEFL